jgi:hypothetical protein
MPTRKKIVRKLPEVGQKFSHKLRGGLIKDMVVVKTKDGQAYKVDGKVFSSPSAAAKFLTGYEENGYKFWHID